MLISYAENTYLANAAPLKLFEQGFAEGGAQEPQSDKEEPRVYNPPIKDNSAEVVDDKRDRQNADEGRKQKGAERHFGQAGGVVYVVKEGAGDKAHRHQSPKLLPLGVAGLHVVEPLQRDKVSHRGLSKVPADKKRYGRSEVAADEREQEAPPPPEDRQPHQVEEYAGDGRDHNRHRAQQYKKQRCKHRMAG